MVQYAELTSLIYCPGQKDEESRSDANSYKITAYKHAIRSVSEVQQPVRLGNDISKVRERNLIPSLARLFS